VQVFDANGSFHSKFGTSGTAPGQLTKPKDLAFLPDDRLIITDNSYLHYFDENGTFLNRVGVNQTRVAVHKDGTVWTADGKLRNADGTVIQSSVPGGNRAVFTPEGDLLITAFINGSSRLQVWKRTYRTKGLVNRNVIPQPAIRGVTQRAGTNVLDLDFEIVDPDDSNATIGIIAYAGSDKLVPQTWVDGTANKIGTPITTNQVHRVSWDVKQDWTTNTGTIKFEILCQDGRTNKPVDLHFLTLPFSDGNMTISRSPLKNSDFLNYAKFLLATGQAQFESNTSNAVVLPGDSNTTIPFTFTNCGVSGRSGPSVSQINSTYAGTSLDGNVTAGWKAGYQKWIVPVTGHYWIEAYGARGGNSAKKGGGGTFVRGKFSLTAGQILNIVVGQTGKDISGSYGASGGGGSFVVTDTNSTPLIIAGGGGGAGGTRDSIRFATGENGADTADTIGGKNGYGGQGGRSGGGGGFLGNGNSYYSGQGGLSFQFGLTGGTPTSSGDSGGFGGGGATHLNSWKQGGGGGGYSGGAAPKGDKGIFSEEGAGGGSFNSGSLQSITPGLNDGHGKVDIRPIQTVRIIDGNWNVLSECKEKLLKSLGSNYRFATTAEVTKAREAATPGAVNNWTASNQVKPRNLPGSVNEYGFDVQTTSGYWVIKE